jgi:hypothetical protein
MRGKLQWLGITLSLPWLVVSGWQGLNLLAHGGNSAALTYSVCVHDAPANKKACEQQFQKDLTAAVNFGWFLLLALMFGPLAAGWHAAWSVALLRRRIKAHPS